MTINAIIVDDEPIMRRSIQRFLKAHPSVQVNAECGDGPSAVRSIEQFAPDVVFLDMQIPGFNGLEVVSRIGLEHMPLTVFITAYGEYAVQAFEARAVDYLVKPFGQNRFDEALRRVVERLPVAGFSIGSAGGAASGGGPEGKLSGVDTSKLRTPGMSSQSKRCRLDGSREESCHPTYWRSDGSGTTNSELPGTEPESQEICENSPFNDCQRRKNTGNPSVAKRIPHGGAPYG